MARPMPVSAQVMRGMGTINLLVVLAVAALALTCVLKMLPVYIENRSLLAILEGIKEEHLAANQPTTRSEIKLKIAKRFNINQIDSISASDVVVEKTKEGYTITANYESRVPLIGNVDVVMKFDNNQVQLPHR